MSQTKNVEYDYVPSQRLYVAVRAVEDEVRQGSKRSEAIPRIAGMLDLRQEDLENCLKARRKKRAVSHPSNASGQKYKYFIIVKKTTLGNDVVYSEPAVRRGLSSETVIKKFFSGDMKETMMRMSQESGYYGNPVSHVVVGEYETKTMAEEAMNEWEFLVLSSQFPLQK